MKICFTHSTYWNLNLFNLIERFIITRVHTVWEIKNQYVISKAHHGNSYRNCNAWVTWLYSFIYRNLTYRNSKTDKCTESLFFVKVKVKSLSYIRLFATPWTVACQAPPSMGFSKQEYWSGLPFPSPRDLPDPGIEPW